jgi:hypothetical protein
MAACPFCRAATPDTVRSSPPPRRIVARLSRAGLIAAGAPAAAIAAVDCGDASEPAYGGSHDGYGLDASDGAADTSPLMFDASYGGPRLDASSDSADGGPPLDSGSDAADGD